LVEPMTGAEYRARQKRRCNGLFSHSNQQNGAQTTKCQMNTNDNGAGGRLADALAGGTHAYTTASWSLSGASVYSKGATVKSDVIGSKPEKFAEYEKWHGTIVNITTQQHRNPYTNVYTLALLDALSVTQRLDGILQEESLVTSWPTCRSLCGRLREVARVIGTRQARRAEREVFFVETGGWDMHSDMKARFTRAMGAVDDAIQQWVREMKAQQVWNNVVLFTSSEFARTLDSNGGGSDHAWAGNHVIMGGAVKGGRLFNRFPARLSGDGSGPRDLGRGRMIPEYPWESFMVPLAKWMGVEDSWMDRVHPNLRYFDTASHIIPVADLFHNFPDAS